VESDVIGFVFPPPVKQVEIPKAKCGTRKLGIPTVSDRIAQTVVKQIIEPKLDPMFMRIRMDIGPAGRPNRR
jgi:retron-type reverse transcriptase